MDERLSGFSKNAERPRGDRPRSLTSIAAAAGVSVSTVSKVLNGRTDVAPETRERVGRMLRRHGYRVASRPGIGVVDLLIGPLGSPWADELIRGAVTAAAETEISAIVSRVTSEAEFGRWLRIAEPYALRASYARDEVDRHLLKAGVRQKLAFTSRQLAVHRLAAGSRLLAVLAVDKRRDRQINYGAGNDVSVESIADAKVPVEIRWYGDSHLDIPVRR